MLVELDNRNWVRSEDVHRVELRDNETHLDPYRHRLWLFDSTGALIFDAGYMTAAERDEAFDRIIDAEPLSE